MPPAPLLFTQSNPLQPSGLIHDSPLRMIKNAIQGTLRTFGYELRRYVPMPPSRLSAFFETWKRITAAPSFIVDVGANRGNWTRCALQYFPEANYLMIEPQERLKKFSRELTDRPNVRWLSAGIADLTGSMMLTLPPRDDSASFALSDTEVAAAGHPQIAVPVTTLDEIVRQEGKIPELVKIDAEGFDLRVLNGALTLLGSTDVFLVECAVGCLQFENTLERVCAHMKEHGYRVIDFTDLNHHSERGILWLTETVFVRESSTVWKNWKAACFAP